MGSFASSRARRVEESGAPGAPGRCPLRGEPVAACVWFAAPIQQKVAAARLSLALKNEAPRIGSRCDFGDTDGIKHAEFQMLLRRVTRANVNALAAFIGCLLFGAGVHAGELEPGATPAIALPSFLPGLWEYRRTQVRGESAAAQVSTLRKCVDPAADMREKMATLGKKNCKFAPLQRSHDRYVLSWTCQTPAGQLAFRDVLTAKSATDYQLASESHTPQGLTQQKIEATRLGECPAGTSPARSMTTPLQR